MNAQEIQNKLASIQSKIKLIEADMSRPEAYEGEYDYLSGLLAKFLGVERQLTAMLSQTSVVSSVNETTPEGTTEVAKDVEYEALTPDLLKDGDYQNGDPVCITIHWAEGKQIYKEEAKFGSFASAQKALEEIAAADENFNEPNTGYIKVKFSIHWDNGESWKGGRIDLACDDENPFALGDFDNLFQKHIVVFLEWHIDNGLPSERFTREGVDEWLANHPLSDADFAVTVPNVISLTEFKAKQQQDEICRKLSGFLAQMPRDRQNSIMHQIKVADDPNAYMQSLLSAMESIEASGF